MKQYVIDELRAEDYEKIKKFLLENFKKFELGEIYQIPLKQSLFTDIQAEHVECQPFYFSILLEPESIAFEMLVRTQKAIRCECVTYATDKQRDWLIMFADSIFEQLEIIV